MSESVSDYGARTMPHDDTAEQSVLGGMMLSKDAIADVVEVLSGQDFYKPAHESIYEAIITLYGHGEPADAVTVADELNKRGELNRVGGAPYLHSLISSVPTAANAGFYAEIVAEQAVLRRLVEAGTKIAQLGYTADGEVESLVNQAQSEIYGVADGRKNEDYVRLGDALDATIDEIEANGARAGGIHGVPTGFIEFDELTAGLQAGQMIVIAARPAMGKALALDTEIPTPTGWTTMGRLSVGDQVLGADGRPTTVTAATEVMENRPCYRLVFDDGSEIIADAEHQWLTRARASVRAEQTVLAGGAGQQSPETEVRTTEQIRSTLRCPSTGTALNHSITTTAPLQLPEAKLPVEPYTFGVNLGSGVLDQERIPACYLRASEQQRRDLLAGLLDAGGTVNRAGAVQCVLTNRALALDVQELVHSLGYRTGLRTQRGEGGSLVFKLTFSTPDTVFSLPRKQEMHRARASRSDSQRFIVAVEPVESVPVRCIQVDNEDHLYLASRAMVPTHNSTFALDIARSAAIKNNMTTVFFSLEMGRNEIITKIISAEASLNLSDLRKGNLDEDQWTRLATATGKLESAPLFIDDSPNMTLMEIRAKARRLKQRNNLQLIVLDYLQLMSSGKKVESRQQEVSEFSRALKLMAKELEVPLIALSQLNRGSEQRTDKKPMVSDLRESGSIEQDADMVVLLHRDDVYDKESPRAGEADVIVAKHRNGPTKTIAVAFQGHYSRFANMTHDSYSGDGF